MAIKESRNLYVEILRKTNNPQKPTIHHQHSTFNTKNKQTNNNPQAPPLWAKPKPTTSQTQTYSKHPRPMVSKATANQQRANPRWANSEHTHGKPMMSKQQARPQRAQTTQITRPDLQSLWSTTKKSSKRRMREKKRRKKRIQLEMEKEEWEIKRENSQRQRVRLSKEEEKRKSLREWKATKERENNIILLIHTCYSKF